MGVEITHIFQTDIDVAFALVAVTTVVLFTPKVLWSFAPHAVRAVPQEKVASEFYWRLRFYVKGDWRRS